jgi:hypothetical protein
MLLKAGLLLEKGDKNKDTSVLTADIHLSPTKNNYLPLLCFKWVNQIGVFRL